MLWLIGCGTKTKLINDIKIQKVKIPDDFFYIPEFKKPHVKNEIDILNAYSLLFYHYKRCEINIIKIKELNNN